MGKGRPRAVEKGVLGQNSSLLASSSGSESLLVPLAPVYYPSDEEFKDPLGFIYKIRDEAEKFGICKIVPPKSWSPPFALNLEEFKFPTKTQAIHQLQARAASCDSKTFELEYNRFLEGHGRKKLRRKVVFEGEELDFCKLFNAAKRFGGYDKVVKEKKWGDVYRFVSSAKKISDCAKHVLSQLYREHLYDYEVYYNQMNKEPYKGCKRGKRDETRRENSAGYVSSKRRRKNDNEEKIKVSNKVEEDLDQICEQCKSGLHGEVMLLCDRCNKGRHIYCLSPPLKEIPPGNWYCFECLNSDKDCFGFIPGKNYSVEAFRRLADRTKKKWFGSGTTSRVQMEKNFWEIVEGLAGEVEVMYGSDLDTSLYGSGFPRINDQRPEAVEAKLWDEYCHSPWNLNNLPKLKGSVLRAVNHNITGVMVPWLYVGMLFSSFCWHFEDHCFYSMNYHHWGDPKCWYSVPGSEASSFEKVMRDSLPDLFDTQPDLLFQLVTMLNPSVLQENGVPVYTVLQEPGNFVITFPRSYHGGFNFGLNCAEAVNFAPADWLPYGGIGAELYKTYHKTAVISHEELLYVVAKGECDNEVSPHLKKELLRMYSNERTWRETLWRSGIVKSSTLPPRKCPDYVGAEEDQACAICKQYLYLSAIKCRCRPSTFVCLEHWRHICECKPSRLRLLYRHTLAELQELLLTVDQCSVGMGLQSSELCRQISSTNDLNALTKKVKGGHINLSQLAEQWLVRSSKILEDTYSAHACAVLLKEAEQFLWAGSEMDSVRDVAKRLVVAQRWAEGVRDCLTKIQNWSIGNSNGVRRVRMNFISKLLNCDPVPCNEPGNLKLKEYAEKAKLLIQEIGSALTSCLKLSDLESLYSRARDFPIYVKESKKLSRKISSAKAWIDNARKCLSEKCPAAVDVDSLLKLKLEIEDLQVQFPEAELILDLARRAELCRAQCCEILSSPMSLMDVEVVLKEFDCFTVNVSELMLLKQYYTDAVSWTSRFNNISMNAHQREDQNNVVNELKSLLKDGASLRIQVDELPRLEVELKKACCRENALKAHNCKMPLEFIEQLMTEAAELCIEKEKLFIETSGVLAAALIWDQRASEILIHGAQMSDFEDMIRSSESISVILPSLNSIHDAVAMANTWLNNSGPFLELPSSNLRGGGSLLKLETLKELVAQSKLLKISLRECEKIELVLKNCDEWEQLASSIVNDAECLFSINYIGDQKINELHKKVDQLKSSAESVVKAGSSIAFDFPEIPKLQNVYCLLQWCARVLSFCSTVPSIKDVESLIDAAEKLSVSCVPGALWKLLVDGVKWLQRALMIISRGSNFERCKLEAAEEVLAESQQKTIAFPVIIDQVVNAIREHKLWQDKVDQFFRLNSAERSWSGILELEESGKAAAFSCLARDLVLSEIRKVDTWKKQCMGIVWDFLDEGLPLLGALQKVKKCLDASLCIYSSLQSGKTRNLCICANGCTEDQQLLTCSICKDCYHLDCLEPEIGHANISEPYICPFCDILKSGSTSQDGSYYLKFGQPRAELRKLMDLLSDAEDFSIMIEEKDALLEVVDKGLKCKACLRDILEFLSSYMGNDLQAFSEKLTVVLKASKVGGVYDHHDSCDLQLLLGRYWWRVRVMRLLEVSKKPTMKQIQLHIKEGLAIDIPSEDYCRQKLTDLKQIGSEWLTRSRKVVMDSGALGLDKVFELILEGEKIPVSVEKELKLLRNRSMLYCICRKPYDDRPKVYCDRCDEWYHVECLKLKCAPKMYVCAACKPDMELSPLPLPMDYERSTSGNFVEPKTPSPRHIKSRKKSDNESNLTQKMQGISNSSNSMYTSGIDQLWWRNRKPFRRAVKRRAVLESFANFFKLNSTSSTDSCKSFNSLN